MSDKTELQAAVVRLDGICSVLGGTSQMYDDIRTVLDALEEAQRRLSIIGKAYVRDARPEVTHND